MTAPATLRHATIAPLAAWLCTTAFAGCSGGGPEIHALSQGLGVNNQCPDGTCMIEEPLIVNVYWKKHIGDFDADVQAAGFDTTSARIDAYTEALVHSDYFDGLKQYGLKSVTRLASIAADDCGAAPSTIEDAHDMIDELSSCIYNHHPFLAAKHGQVVLNVLISPTTMSKPNGNWCAPGTGSALAEHSMYGDGISAGPFSVTFVPVWCNKSLAALGDSIPHELDEAITDPQPASSTGWKDHSVIPTQEINDLCGAGPRTFPFLADQLGTVVSQYWSNDDSGCIPGFDTTAPTVSSASVCGAGRNMKITLKGSFGPAPWDLVTTPPSPLDNGRSTSMYLAGTVNRASGATWSVGRVMALTADPENFGVTDWTSGGGGDTVTIHGFDDHYGFTINGQQMVVRSGDTIDLFVSRVDNGQLVQQTVSVPGPSLLADVDAVATDSFGYAADGWIFFDAPALIRGQVQDPGACAVEGAAVQLSSNDPGQPVWKAETDDEGRFSSKLVASVEAGPRKVTVEVKGAGKTGLQFDVHPRLSGAASDIGTVMGGQAITLTGAGFPKQGSAASVAVRFGKDANVATVSPVALSLDGKSLTVKTPASPLPGQAPGLVDIVVAVNGVDSNAISFQYVVPYQPVLSLISPPCPGIAGKIAIDAYDAAGLHVSEPVKLTSVASIFAPGVTTVTSSSGSTVWLVQSPPAQITVTATGMPPGVWPQPAPITNTFNVQVASADCIVPFTLIEYWYFDPAGPVETIELPVDYSQDRRDLVWSFSGVASRQSTVTLGTEKGATPRTPGLNVVQVGASELHAITRGGGEGFVLRDHAAGFNKGTTALAGVAFRLFVQRDITGPATVSFALPPGADPASYAVLVQAPGAVAWVESTATVTRGAQGLVLAAEAKASGTFALATLR